VGLTREDIVLLAPDFGIIIEISREEFDGRKIHYPDKRGFVVSLNRVREHAEHSDL